MTIEELENEQEGTGSQEKEYPSSAVLIRLSHVLWLSMLQKEPVKSATVYEALGIPRGTWNSSLSSIDKWLNKQANVGRDPDLPPLIADAFVPESAAGRSPRHLTREGWELAAIGIMLRWLLEMRTSGLTAPARENLLARTLYRFEQDWRDAERERVIKDYADSKNEKAGPPIPASKRQPSPERFDWLNAWVRPRNQDMTMEDYDPAWEEEMERHTREAFEDHFLPPMGPERI